MDWLLVSSTGVLVLLALSFTIASLRKPHEDIPTPTATRIVNVPSPSPVPPKSSIPGISKPLRSYSLATAPVAMQYDAKMKGFQVVTDTNIVFLPIENIPQASVSLQGVTQGVSGTAFQNGTGCVFSADAKSVYLAEGWDYDVQRFDVQSGKATGDYRGMKNYLASLAVDKTGSRVAAGSSDNKVYVWDGNSHKLLQSLDSTVHNAITQFKQLAFTPNGGNLLVVAGTQLTIWDTRTWKVMDSIRLSGGDCLALSVSPDGRMAALSMHFLSSKPVVLLYDLTTKKLARTLSGATGAVPVLAFSPDSKLLAVGSKDKTVLLYEVATGKIKTVFRGNGGPVYRLAFSADGKVLAAGTEFRTVKLWAVP